jgi:DNA-binding GntR family transcriptional regulator
MERIQQASLTDQVYDILKRRIIGRDIQSNEKLDVNGLASQLGVSRMPVVDALTRLEGEGLVERRNRVGTFVAPVDERTFQEWFEMRAMIEDWAAPRIAQRTTADEVRRIQGLLDEGRAVLRRSRADAFDFYKFIETYDTGFHIALLNIAGNSLVIETFSTIHSHARIGRSFVPPAGQLTASEKSQADHEMILKAVASRKATAIAAAMRDHRESSQSSTLRGLRTGRAI